MNLLEIIQPQQPQQQQQLFTKVHICLQLITRIQQKLDKRVYSPYCGTYMGDCPNLYNYIRNRSIMTKIEFEAYLCEKYTWWVSNFYKNEDTTFFDFFTREIMQEITQLEEEWANSAIDLEVYLTKIISFFMKHLECESPMQIFLIQMHILSSKCFYIDRKRIAKKWKYQKGSDLFENVEIKKKIKIQAFLFQSIVNFLTINPELLPEIKNLRENDAQIFDSIIIGFKMLTTLFLKKNFKSPNVSHLLQNKICISTCNFAYEYNRDAFLWYQMLNKRFHAIQNMNPKFRRFIIMRSQFCMILIWRMYNYSKFNRIPRLQQFMYSKLMLFCKRKYIF